jgi:hypothetical protein
MASIRLADAAKHDKQLPHQLAAWNWLQEQLSAEELAEFGELYRAAPPPKPLDTPNTWAGVMDAAKRAGARYPELVAAQWALESGHGKHTSGKYNYFGLKGPGTKARTQEVINGKTVTITDEFLDFRDIDHCVTYLVDLWHRNWRDHIGVNNALNRDAAARELVKQGYATDPEYATKLIRLMNEKAPAKAAAAPQPAKLTPASPFTAHITPHIQLGEFALFQEERRFDHQYQLDTAAELAAFMERCRTHFGGKPVIVTSGYRPLAINRAVGGASGSEHLYDAPSVGAVDFYIKGASIEAVQDWCDKQWPYSLGYGAPKGFCHIGIRQGRPRVRWDYG